MPMARSRQVRDASDRAVEPKSRLREDGSAQRGSDAGECCPRGARLEVDDRLLAEVDPDGIYVGALAGYPYLMTPAQVAAFTQTTPAGVRKLLSSGRLKGSRMGSRWVIPKLCLLRYLNGAG